YTYTLYPSILKKVTANLAYKIDYPCPAKDCIYIGLLINLLSTPYIDKSHESYMLLASSKNMVGTASNLNNSTMEKATIPIIDTIFQAFNLSFKLYTA